MRHAPGALQALVGRLRRALGREAISSGPGGYRLEAAAQDIDLRAFEQLVREGSASLAGGDPEAAAAGPREALALWRGPALADLPDGETVAARPEALRMAALRRRIDADLALGHAGEVLPELRELVADHPLDEPFRGQLIRALRASGGSAEALVAYEEARRVLADRLGADPGPELRVLQAQLLAGTGPQPQARLQSETEGRQGNLRARLTSFVGREAELRDLRRDLSAARLVTLTGPGGSGKTRLSQEAAEAAARAYPDGVWFAELAPLDHPSAVPRAVLSALGRRNTTLFSAGHAAHEVRTAGGHADPGARVLEHCAQRRLLLVLDNCEHVIGAAAELTDALLSSCPGVTVLATSREPLGVPEEAVRPVEPLPPSIAHQLFAQRAAAVRPGFDPGEDPDAVCSYASVTPPPPPVCTGAAESLRGPLPRTVPEEVDLRTVEGAARAEFGDAAYDTARAEGRALDPDAAHALLAGMKWVAGSVSTTHEGGDFQ